MRVRIQLFAQLRELMGGDLHEAVEGDRITVAALHRHLERAHPALGPYLPTLAVAINREYCLDAATEIGPGDEVALIQPISGGAAIGAEQHAAAAPAPRYLVTRQPLDRDALRDLVATDASGAVVLFEGVVRNHHEGRGVARLEYEAYAPMAERQLAATGDEVLAAYAERDVHQVAAHHRVGMLEVGDVSLLVAVSAAHRADAFEAALLAVDRIKETVPVWKREHGTDGSMWQEGVDPRPAGAERLAGA